MRRINIGLILVGLFIATLLVLDACGKIDNQPTISDAEASARLKASEAERARELEEMNTTEVYIESSEYITEATTEITTVYIEPETPEYIEEEIKEHIIHTEAETEEVVNSNPYGFTDDEIWEIARITYLENGCEGYYYPTYLTACVIINRYLDWDYDSIEDVIFAEGQYSTAYKYTNWGGRELVISDMTWQAVYDAMADTDRNPHYQMNGGSGNLYYQHPETGECFYY